uniref:Cytochrome c oxidase subunit 2 n=18 Tax=Meloidogyne TaxID=189290 RepID=A0A0C5B161_MELEN|nr:cytochrome c oxidase subunit II [Meloidogyne enterolobii]AJK90854.1 cytochrome c oxidase subunit II [Meloidogyne enterolobii]
MLLNFNLISILFSYSEMNFFHDYNCYLLVYIMIFIIYCYLFFMGNLFFQKILLNYKMVEFKCCLLPFLILLMQLFPSLMLFFEMIFFLEDYNLTVKVMGHQWYWTYEYSDLFNFSFDSYMLNIEYLMLGSEMFMEVDNRLILPNDLLIRFVCSSTDVIHAWVLPMFFLKTDVMSGLMTVFSFNFDILGLFYGQCSEICGVNHSFMPILVEVTLFDFFKLNLLTN